MNLMKNIMNKKRGTLILVISLILIVSFAMIILILPTTMADSGLDSVEMSTVSNVTVGVWIGMTFSTRLTSEGIAFGILNDGSNNQSASYNENASSMTEYYVTAAETNTVGLDLFIKDDANLSLNGLGITEITNTGYLYSFSEYNNATHPVLDSSVAITEAYIKTQHTNLVASSSSYARFWLSIPALTTNGVYNNTVYIKAIETGASC